jgi:WD repeat-containing protein 44
MTLQKAFRRDHVLLLTFLKHIFMRTNTAESTNSRLRNPAPFPRLDSAEADDEPSELPSRRALLHDGAKDKKKSGTFLSRLSMRGSKKREDAIPDTDSELSEQQRAEGKNAPVFSSIVGAGGFIPIHKEPPRYIRIKAQNKKTRDFHRMFLAQELVPGGTAGDTGAEIEIPQEARERRKSMSTVARDDRSIKSADKRPRRAIWATEFSRDGKYLATAGKDAIVRVWAVITSPAERKSEGEAESKTDQRLSAPVFREKPVYEFIGHESDVLDLSWSKNNFLLSCGMDKTVRLWHMSRKECLCTFKHKDIVTKIAFHPTDDRFFLAGSLDSVLRLWSIPDKAVAFSAQLPDMVTAVALSPDGKTAIAGMLSGLCSFYETEGLKLRSQIHVRSSRGKNAKGSKITGIQTMLVPPPSPIPSAARPGSASSSRPDIVTSPTSTAPVTDRSEIKVLITSNDSRIRVYDLKDKSLELKLKGHENMVSQIAARFSDDGRYIISGSENARTYIWGLDGLDEEPNKDKWPVEYFEAHSGVVTSAVFAPTKTRMILNGSGDPIYDLCNPPPVTLMSVGDMESEARGSTTSLGFGIDTSGQKQSTPAKASEASQVHDDHVQAPAPSAAYIARSTHYDGNIIVTASDAGCIKVFRQDCAFSKRRYDWETASLGRKIVHGPAAHAINNTPLGRSASILTRTSASSAAHSRRGSLSLAANGQVVPIGSPQLGSDRILTWRQGIEGHRASVTSTPSARSERSISPGKIGRGSIPNLSANAANEARRMPYVQHAATSATNSPTAAIFTQRAEAGKKVLEGKDESASSNAQRARTTESNASTDDLGRQGASPLDSEEMSPTNTTAADKPPLPSFTFRPADNDSDQLRLDAAGASYSFWNLNRWRGGIASLRDSVSGATTSSAAPARTISENRVHSLIPGFSLLNPVKERDASASPDVERDRVQGNKSPRRPGERRKSSGADRVSGHADEGGVKEDTLVVAQIKQDRRKSTPPLSSTFAQTLSNVLPSILSPASVRSSNQVAAAAETTLAQTDSADNAAEAEEQFVDATDGEPSSASAKPSSTDLLAPPDTSSRRASQLSSGVSVVSQLSDELTSSDGEELRCPNCGGKDFKARRIGGRQRLLCGRCGHIMHVED